MDGKSPYARYSNNWLIARELLQRQQKAKQRSFGGKESLNYYGGVPYWMNHRHRTVETYDANQFLLVNKLEIPPAILQTEPSKVKKTHFRIATNRSIVRPMPQSEPNIAAAKKPREENRLKSLNEVNFRTGVSHRVVKKKQTSAPPQKASVSKTTSVQEKSVPLIEDDIYLPAPRIIYETYGPSN